MWGTYYVYEILKAFLYPLLSKGKVSWNWSEFGKFNKVVVVNIYSSCEKGRKLKV